MLLAPKFLKMKGIHLNLIQKITCKSVSKVIFCSIAWIICILQIIELVNISMTYEVKQKVVYMDNLYIKPPYVTFCISIPNIIDAEKILSRYPFLTNILIKRKEKHYKNDIKWSLPHMLTNDNYGRWLIYMNLTIIDIAIAMPKLSSIMATCVYLTQRQTYAQCSVDNFTPFFYDHSLCFTFRSLQLIGNKLNPPIPGFEHPAMMKFCFNFTAYPEVTEIVAHLHDTLYLPWYRNLAAQNLKIEHNKTLWYYIPYREAIRSALHGLHGSHCKLPSNYQSLHECYSSCLINPYVEITGRYPRNSIISLNNTRYMMPSYEEEMVERPIALKLNKMCRKLCGTLDCKEHNYFFSKKSLYSSQQNSDCLTCIAFRLPSGRVSHYQKKSWYSLEILLAAIGGIISLWFGTPFKLLHRNIDHDLINGVREFWEWLQKLRNRPVAKPLQVEVYCFEKMVKNRNIVDTVRFPVPSKYQPI